MAKIFPFHPPRRAALRAVEPAASDPFVVREIEDNRLLHLWMQEEREKRRQVKAAEAKRRAEENDYFRTLDNFALEAFPWGDLQHVWKYLRKYPVFGLTPSPGRVSVVHFPTAMLWASAVIDNEKGFELFQQVRPGVSRFGYDRICMFTPFPREFRSVAKIVRLFVNGRIAINRKAFSPDISRDEIKDLLRLARYAMEERSERLKDATGPGGNLGDKGWAWKPVADGEKWFWLSSTKDLLEYAHMAHNLETKRMIRKKGMTKDEVIERLKSDPSIPALDREEMLAQIEELYSPLPSDSYTPTPLD